jgi:hypothetical protein
MKIRKMILSAAAAVAIMGAAFAMKPKPVLVDYYVSASDATHFTVTTQQDLACTSQQQPVVCKISTTAAPDEDGRIARSAATETGWKPAP